MSRKLTVIKCPVCGREYLPAEIFVPKYFFGSPEYIVRNDSGEIEEYIGTTLDTAENYVCDKCNSSIKIEAKINFSVCVDESINFDTDYTTFIK